MSKLEMAPCCGHPVVDHFGGCGFCACRLPHDEALAGLLDQVRTRARDDERSRLADRWRALPVWGPDERGLYILDGVDHVGLMDDLFDRRGSERRNPPIGVGE